MDAQLDFLKATVLSRSAGPVTMYSDLPMVVRNVKGYRNLQKSSGSNRRKKWKRTRISR